MPKVNFFTQSLEFIFHQVTELRRKLYDVRIFKTHKFQVPILSVGNVSFGGTGKTPFVLWLCSFMDKRKLSYAVVARSYGGTITSPTRVDPDSVPGAFEYGDEPFLLSQRLSNTDIYVGSKKYAVAAFALTQKKYNVLILDDGFQHFPLKRDLDIVLIDAAAGVEILKRESWKSLQRAQVLVFTKINYTTKDQLETFKAFIPQGKIILNASYRSSLKSWTEDGKILNLENLRGKKVYSFCGLGNPEIFFKSIDEKNPQIHLKRTFPDHHQYTLDDFLKIQKEIENQNFDFILVSLKDLVKLKVFIKPENQKKSPIQNSSVQNSSIPISKDFYNKIFYIDIDLEISGDLKAFEKVIDEILV